MISSTGLVVFVFGLGVFLFGAIATVTAAVVTVSPDQAQVAHQALLIGIAMVLGGGAVTYYTQER